MSHIIKWTFRAEADYLVILDYLESNWTKKELLKFTTKTSKAIVQISKTPKAFPASKKKNVRKCVLVKQVSIYYRIKKKEIELLTFWDNRRRPKKLKL